MRDRQDEASALADSVVAEQQVANSSLTPEQVVEIQIRAAQLAVDEPEQWKTVFSLSPPYDSIAHSKEFLIGDAQITDGHAYVSTSVFVDDGVAGFVFGLRKQTKAPFEDCWMTEMVQPIPIHVDDQSESLGSERSGDE